MATNIETCGRLFWQIGHLASSRHLVSTTHPQPGWRRSFGVVAQYLHQCFPWRLPFAAVLFVVFSVIDFPLQNWIDHGNPLRLLLVVDWYHSNDRSPLNWQCQLLLGPLASGALLRWKQFLGRPDWPQNLAVANHQNLYSYQPPQAPKTTISYPLAKSVAFLLDLSQRVSCSIWDNKMP